MGDLLPSSATYTKERRWTSATNIQNYHIEDKKAGEIQPSLDAPAKHAHLCQKRGRGTGSKSFQGRWAIGLMINFFLIESPKSCVSFWSTSVIITLSTQDFPKRKTFIGFILEAGGFRLLSHWVGSWVGLKRIVKVQSCISTKEEWTKITKQRRSFRSSHSYSENTLTEQVSGYSIAPPKEEQQGKNVLVWGFKCLIPSL